MLLINERKEILEMQGIMLCNKKNVTVILCAEIIDDDFITDQLEACFGDFDMMSSSYKGHVDIDDCSRALKDNQCILRLHRK